MDVLLMSLTGVGVLVLFGALAVYLVKIATTLEAIGGEPTSYLAKIAFGVRAIEQETSHLEPQVRRLNDSLAVADELLGGLEERLGAVLEAVEAQEG